MVSGVKWEYSIFTNFFHSIAINSSNFIVLITPCSVISCSHWQKYHVWAMIASWALENKAMVLLWIAFLLRFLNEERYCKPNRISSRHEIRYSYILCFSRCHYQPNADNMLHLYRFYLRKWFISQLPYFSVHFPTSCTKTVQMYQAVNFNKRIKFVWLVARVRNCRGVWSNFHAIDIVLRILYYKVMEHWNKWK